MPSPQPQEKIYVACYRGMVGSAIVRALQIQGETNIVTRTHAYLRGVVLRIDPGYFRLPEVKNMLGNPAKAKSKLGWMPEITVRQMCAEMVATDLEEAQKQPLLDKHGYLCDYER